MSIDCKYCDFSFSAIETGPTGYAGCAEKESIYCPKCGKLTMEARTSGYWETKPTFSDFH